MTQQQRNQNSDEKQKRNSKAGTHADQDATAKGQNDTLDESTMPAKGMTRLAGAGMIVLYLVFVVVHVLLPT